MLVLWYHMFPLRTAKSDSKKSLGAFFDGGRVTPHKILYKKFTNLGLIPTSLFYILFKFPLYFMLQFIIFIYLLKNGQIYIFYKVYLHFLPRVLTLY